MLNNHLPKKNRVEKFKYYCTWCDYGIDDINMFQKHNNTQKHIKFETIILDMKTNVINE